MSAELSTMQWLDTNQAYFEEAARTAAEIAEQNRHYLDLIVSEGITFEPFREEITNHLTDEQNQTFETLKAAKTITPYEELFTREQALAAALEQIAHQLQAVEEQTKADMAYVHHEQQEVAKRIPTLAKRLGVIAINVQQEAILRAKTALESQQAALLAEYGALSRVYETAGQSWPLPAIIVAQQERAGEITQIEASPEASTDRKREWEPRFTEAVAGMIARFRADGLMQKPELSWVRANRQSSSDIMATKVMGERGVRNGIITSNELDSDLPIHKFICMALQNANREIFSNPNRRPTAMRIVEQAVADYFEAQELANHDEPNRTP